MPERRKSETLQSYVSRCITTRRHEYPEEPEDKSIAACYAMGRSWWKSKDKKKVAKR